MIRGTTKFKCPKCGRIFRGPDVEWNAASLSAPMPCPECGTESPAIKDRLSGGKGMWWLLSLGGLIYLTGRLRDRN